MLEFQSLNRTYRIPFPFSLKLDHRCRALLSARSLEEQVISVRTHRRAEHTAAALQLCGGCGRLLTEAQLAEDFQEAARCLGAARCRLPNFRSGGDTPAGHHGAADAGRESREGLRTLLELLLGTVRSSSLAPWFWKEQKVYVY